MQARPVVEAGLDSFFDHAGCLGEPAIRITALGSIAYSAAPAVSRGARKPSHEKRKQYAGLQPDATSGHDVRGSASYDPTEDGQAARPKHDIASMGVYAAAVSCDVRSDL
jgi:hypothetical protein